MANHWLRNTRSAIFDTRLKDYAGQPLTFTKPGTPHARRCVSEEVFQSEAIQQLIKRLILEDEASTGQPPVAAPTPAKAPEPKAAPPEPPVAETPAEPEVTPDPEPEVPAVEEAKEEEPEEVTKPKRRKRGRKG